MMLLLSILLSLIPVLVYLIILWRLDRYEREPLLNILLHFFWGMFGAVILTLFFGLVIEEYAILKIKDALTLDFFSTVFVAPIIEEFFKGMILIFTFSGRKFDNLTDGIVYGGSIGLGFGLTENFLYFFSYGSTINDLIYLAIFRNIFSVTIHFVASAVLGSMLAIAKFKTLSGKIFLYIAGYLIAVFIHGIFNLSVIKTEGLFFSMLFVFVAFAFMMILLFLSLNMEQNFLIYELTDEVFLGYLNLEYAKIIPYYRKRTTKGWINEKHRKNLINWATTLAFRKNQVKNTKSEKIKNIYKQEIDILRSKIRSLANEYQ